MVAIEQVHSVGRSLPVIPVLTDSSLAVLGRRGEYYPDASGPFIAIAFDGPWPILTALHEYAHFLDHSGIFGSKTFGDFSSDDPQLLQGWRTAVKNSKAIRELKAARDSDGLLDAGYGLQVRIPAKDLDYLLSDREMFARSYAQFVATRCRDAVLKSQIDKALADDATAIERRFWQRDDFDSIADEFEKLLRREGMRQ
jgi:hypothetical protein